MAGKGTYPSIGPENWVRAGERMRKAREAKGLTLSELSVVCGYKCLSGLMWIEHGRKNPANLRPDTLNAICVALDMTAEEFCGDCYPTMRRKNIHKTHCVSSAMKTPLARARAAADMTQDELAEKLGIKRTTLAKIEGDFSPVPTYLCAAVDNFIAEHPYSDPPAPATPGERLAKMRKEAGLTQAALAQGIGVPKWRIVRMEHDIYTIQPDVWAKIKEFLVSDDAETLRGKHVIPRSQVKVVGVVDDSTVAQLRARRKALGVKQREIGEVIGRTSNGIVSRLELGRMQMTTSDAQKIDAYLRDVEKLRMKK